MTDTISIEEYDNIVKHNDFLKQKNSELQRKLALSVDKKQTAKVSKVQTEKVLSSVFPKWAMTCFEKYVKRNDSKTNSIGYELVGIVESGKTATLKKYDFNTKVSSTIEVPVKVRRAIIRKTYNNHDDAQIDALIFG